MQKTIASLLAFHITAVSSAQNVTVYRWVDEKNVVHYSQHQPKHNDFTELSLSVLTKPKNQQTEVNKKSENEVETLNALSKKRETLTQSDASKSICEQAKNNVTTLRNYDKIQYTDENGEIKVLSDLEKEQQLAINEKQVEVYCEL